MRLRGAGAAALLLAAAAPLRAGAFWPFGGDDDESKDGPGGAGGPGGLPPGMEFAFGGVPVIHVDSHFGFDPFEDFHKNVEKLMEKSAQDGQMLQPAVVGGPVGGGALVSPFELQLGGLMQAFGEQHAGHFGRAEGSFEVNDEDPTRLRISAQLPGYKLDKEGDDPNAESPLSVRAIGKRSLVVSGSQQDGPFLRTWQRSFSLPKGSDIDQVAVTYNAASGNLTVEVPRHNVTEDSSADDEAVDDEAELDAFLPPPLRAMQAGLPGLVRHVTAGGQPQPRGGFLMPAGPDPIAAMFGEAFGMLDRMHPRFQPPPGGEQAVPEDAEVNLVGCFAESQLAKVELKYYAEANAASFNAMYWHARSDHVNYFAMSRHDAPMGHAFTAKGFVHEDEKPQWGIYDGCGTRCEDNDDHWCGCANEASRGLANQDCPTEGEKRFAVYKIGNTASLQEDNATAQQQAGQAAVSAQGRPYWQLAQANGSSESAIEIVVPKGQVAKANGREVLLYSENATASDSQGDSAGAPADAEPAEVAEAAQATAAPHASTVGKVRLPVGVSPEACEYDASRKTEDGGQVLKCKLQDNVVKRLPIKVVDEL